MTVFNLKVGVRVKQGIHLKQLKPSAVAKACIIWSANTPLSVLWFALVEPIKCSGKLIGKVAALP